MIILHLLKELWLKLISIVSLPVVIDIDVEDFGVFFYYS